MVTPRRFFHFVSYLQYPIMASAFLFYVPFMISMFSGEPDWTDLNYVLILMGVSISFSTLQDTTTTQNNFSKKIWEHPKKGKVTLFLMIIAGLILLFTSESSALQNIALGITILGIGLMGLLKAAIEMFENHRLDKHRLTVDEAVSEL